MARVFRGHVRTGSFGRQGSGTGSWVKAERAAIRKTYSQSDAGRTRRRGVGQRPEDTAQRGSRIRSDSSVSDHATAIASKANQRPERRARGRPGRRRAARSGSG